jgi:hypothetical protein
MASSAATAFDDLLRSTIASGKNGWLICAGQRLYEV